MGPLTLKAPGWEARLYEALAEAAAKPFTWGTHDCGIWSVDTISKLREVPSPADRWRGRYRTAAGSVRVHRRMGWVTHHDAAVALYGEPLQHLLTAQRGDLVLTGQDAFGICVGSKVALLTEDRGMHYAPLHEGLFAWRI